MSDGRVLRHINLYQAEFRPRRAVFPARSLLAGLGLLALGLLLLHGWGVWQNRQLADRVSQATRQAETLESRLAALSQTRQDPGGDPAAEQASARLEQRLAALARGEQAIRAGAAGTAQGWSRQFSALTRVRVPGLWLTGVELAGSPPTMTLHGRALDGGAPARYIALLRQSPPFVGLEFATLSIGEPEPESGPGETAPAPGKPAYLEFTLAGPAPTEAAPPPGEARP